MPLAKKSTVAAVIPLHTLRPGIPRNAGPAWSGIPARLTPELWPGISRNTQDEFRDYADKLSALAAYGDDKSVSGSSQKLDELLEKLHSSDLASAASRRAS